MRLLLLLSIVAASAGEARAEDVPAVDEATLIATLAGDPRVERIASEADAAAANVEVAKIRPEPRIALEREELFPAGGGVATQYLRVVAPVDLSGRRGRGVAAAQATARAARAQADADGFTVIVEGIRHFREAAYARLQVATLTAERASLVRAVDIVAKRARAGEASGYDRQRLELELTSYDDQITSAVIELRASQRRLATLLGRPGARVDAAGGLELPAVASLETLLPGAIGRRGDYRAARLRISATAAERAAAARTWIPVLELTAGAMSSDVGTETATGYVVGVSFTLPVFDRGGAAQRRATAARRGAIADAKRLEREVPAAIGLAHDEVTARAARARTFEAAQLARLDQLLRTAETAYRDGGGSVVELLDAYRTARDARLHELALRRDASFAELDLWLALGRRP